MASKSDKEKKSAGKNGLPEKPSAQKPSSKSKKQLEDDDEDDENIEEEVKPVSKKGKPAAASKKEDDDEESDDVNDELDDWEKPEEEEEWDPDFEEFDIPKPTGKKSGKKVPGDEEDFKFEDDEFKDLFGDKTYDDDDEEEDY